MPDDGWGQLTLVPRQSSANNFPIFCIACNYLHCSLRSLLDCTLMLPRQIINWKQTSSRLHPLTQRLCVFASLAILERGSFSFSFEFRKVKCASYKRGVIRIAGLIAVICEWGPVLQCQRHLKYNPERFFLPVNIAELTFFSNRWRFRVVGLVVDSGIQVFSYVMLVFISNWQLHVRVRKLASISVILHFLLFCTLFVQRITSRLTRL